MFSRIKLAIAVSGVLLLSACEKWPTPGEGPSLGYRLKAIQLGSDTVSPNFWKFDYNQQGKVTRITLTGTSQPAPYDTMINLKIRYNAQGRVSLVIPPAVSEFPPQPFQYHYDGYGRLKQLIQHKDGQTTDTATFFYKPNAGWEENPDIALHRSWYMDRSHFYFLDNKRNYKEISYGTGYHAVLLRYFFTYTNIINPEFDVLGDLRLTDLRILADDSQIFIMQQGYMLSRFMPKSSTTWYSNETTAGPSWEYTKDAQGRVSEVFEITPEGQRSRIKKYIYE
ncbi:hypothetical protein MKQ68_19220 [Chitinophaga horti]|uniref:YD repeat-containing protein n=1 Tax=Chitinophaga horti TaxID=2920382 RepID=A0ABY6IXV1_9BACT|nr:hypothetical protein [Chitinophaga horti]UYQ92220.1 hypothetical protein MKQ68_19220 [Chitinophaga horti]